MIRIILARHGETDWNATGRVQGWSEVPLNDFGLAQAQRLAQRLKEESIQAVYCSDLGRARQTAEICAAPHALEPISLADLRERCYGVWEGLTEKELLAEYAELWDRYHRRRELNVPIPGGEEWVHVFTRMNSVLDRLVAEHSPADHQILIVGHGGSLRTMLLRAMGAPLPVLLHLQTDNASLSRLSFTAGGEGRLISLNDVCHLSGLTK